MADDCFAFILYFSSERNISAPLHGQMGGGRCAQLAAVEIFPHNCQPNGGNRGKLS